MSAYATTADVQARLNWTMDLAQRSICEELLNDAGVIIDTFAASAPAETKKVVSCRMVMRALGDGTVSGVPMGATQGSMTAGPYSQSWTMSSGSTGELYLSKLEKSLLGGYSLGASNPYIQAGLVPPEVEND